MHARGFRCATVEWCVGVITMSVTQLVSHQEKSILQSRKKPFHIEHIELR